MLNKLLNNLHVKYYHIKAIMLHYSYFLEVV